MLVAGGVIQNICEDSWEMGGFRRLRDVTMASCRSPLDTDLGFLIISSAA